MSKTPTQTSTLSFSEFRRVNQARCLHWTGGQFPPLTFAGIELGEETGEVQGAIKKLTRLQNGWAGGRDTTDNLREELADVVICADLIAMQLEIDLGAAVVAKFNATSEKHGFPHRLALAAQPDRCKCERCAARVPSNPTLCDDCRAEMVGCCEGCDKPLFVGDTYSLDSEGVHLCATCSPTERPTT